MNYIEVDMIYNLYPEDIQLMLNYKLTIDNIIHFQQWFTSISAAFHHLVESWCHSQATSRQRAWQEARVEELMVQQLFNFRTCPRLRL